MTFVRTLRLACGHLLSLLLGLMLAATAAAQTQLIPGNPEVTRESYDANNGEPVRLRQSEVQAAPDDRNVDGRRTSGSQQTRQGQQGQQGQQVRASSKLLPLYVPGEFELFVQQQAGPDVEIRRFGAELVTGSTEEATTTDPSPLVPSDYVVAPGDEILITLWGSVDADLRSIVDRTGRISIPRVGAVQVAGVRHADLQEVVNRRVAQVFRNFQSSVTLGQLRGVRVFVTGFAVRPGTYTVSSLSTVVTALMHAGGPSAAGSFRNIELRRGKELVGRFDLYDLLLRGDRSADRLVQSGDVVHVGAVGAQVGVIGSVNNQAVIEVKPGETVADALAMAGGFTSVADRTRVALERLKDRNAGRVVELALPAEERSPVGHGDVLRAFSAVAAILSTQGQAKRVRVEGEVLRPGEYVLPERSSTSDAIKAAGGFASSAFVFATEFTRLSVQRTQQQNYDRALRDLETDFARASGTQRVASADEAASVSARTAASARLVERLRALKPTGRIVLQLPTDAIDLPDLALEDGDRIYIPSRPTTVGVFGSVFNASSYLHTPGRSIDDYLRLAGGPTRGADEGSIFVIRANGTVASGRQLDSGWFDRSTGFQNVSAQPGDTVFVPEEMDKTTWTQITKDWTQILLQFGLGVAGIAAAF